MVSEYTVLLSAGPCHQPPPPSPSCLLSPSWLRMQVSSKHAFCEGTPEWRCLEAWRTHATEYATGLQRHGTLMTIRHTSGYFTPLSAL